MVHNTPPQHIQQEKTTMIVSKSTLSALFVVLAVSGPVIAQDPVAGVVEGCAVEIETYCSQVSVGEGRMLACFYAHEDKLSSQCQYALYQAAAALDQAVSALNYVAGQCADDIVNLCASVEAGEGRILDCLAAQEEAVSCECKAAVEQVFE